ncbi:MFS transporter [Halarsenatibacter silvermanii]|uniref:Predicted arabinose efflux permease, MFS family n=1 Tax=Halarsenatibacter silvermanii TaxID=321763 RepID=A0A1G9H6Z6_9FIRM|nr:MFS transporter [Halarsenatibacter silvermanii]SDL08662.1 Predicted arabinose efflux permease, MFS family [Halarsenatibacter silvermanii]
MSGKNDNTEISRRRSDRILLLLGIILFLNGLGSGVAFPIIPLLGSVIGVSPFFISMIISANRISRVIFNTAIGELVDRYGCRGPLIWGLLIKALSVAGFIFSIWSPVIPGHLFFISRFLYGIGSAMGFITTYAFMFHLTDRSNRGSRTAYIRTAGLFGLPSGLFIGGLLSDYFGYSAAFAFSAGSLFLFTLLAYSLIPGDIDSTPETEVLGPVRAVRLALTDSRVLRISSANFLEWFAVQGVFLSTAALFVERIDLSLGGLGAEGMSGLLMGVMMFTKGLSTLILGRFIDGASTRSFFSLVGASMGVLAFLSWALFRSLAAVTLGLLLLGTCSGITSSPLLTLLGDVSRPELRGKSLGIYRVFGDAGGMLGPIFGVNAAEGMGFTPTYLILALVMTAIMAIILPLYRRERRDLLTNPQNRS